MLYQLMPRNMRMFPQHTVCTAVQALRKLIEDCWTSDPEARPTVEEIVNRLEDMLRDMPKHSPYSKAQEGCQCSLQ